MCLIKGFVRLSHRSLLLLEGKDTFKYLQAYTTNNLKPPVPQYSSFLTAQGRVLYDVFIYPIADEKCYIEVDSSKRNDLVNHLKRYKLRSKFTLRDVDPDEQSIWSSWGIENHTTAGVTTQCKDLRAADMGDRLIIPNLSKPDLAAEEGTLEDYTIRRYMRGIPEGPAEIIEGSALPMESNIDIMNGVDFHKGCYLGQELTVRTHYTGVIRKRIVPIQFYRSDEQAPSAMTYDKNSSLRLPEGGSNFSQPDRKRPAGKYLAGVGNIGLALAGLELVQSGEPCYVEYEGKHIGLKAFLPPEWKL